MAAVKSKGSASVNATAQEVLDIARMCYSYSRPYFDRANRDMQLYDQVIDPKTWSTMSEITTGQAFQLVQDTVPAILDMVIWGAEYPFKLVPLDEDTTPETVDKVTDNLMYTLRERMEIDIVGDMTLQECIKLGKGYTIVEPKVITPPSQDFLSITTGRKSDIRPIMGLGDKKLITSSTFLPFGQVLASPGATCCDDAEAITVFRFIGESKLREMFAAEELGYEGDVEEIIKYARENRYNANVYSWQSIMAKLCGWKTLPSVYNRWDGRAKYPVQVPIIQQFRKNRHVFLACDKFVILDKENKFETLRCPVVDATFAPDGTNFYTSGIVDKAGSAISATEQWLNAMFDMLSLHLHPHIIENRLANVEYEKDEDISPYNRTLVSGDIRTAIDTIVPKQIPPQLFDLGNQLRPMINEVTGQNVSANRASPGMVRGGLGALESIMSASTGRQRLLSRRIENHWFKKIVDLALINNQILIDSEDKFVVEKTAKREIKGKNGKTRAKVGQKYYDNLTVTIDDVRQLFQVEFDFRDKLSNPMSEFSFRAGVFDRLQSRPDINPVALEAFLLGDHNLYKKITQGVDREKRKQEIIDMANPQKVAPQGAGGASAMPMGATGTEDGMSGMEAALGGAVPGGAGSAPTGM